MLKFLRLSSRQNPTKKSLSLPGGVATKNRRGWNEKKERLERKKEGVKTKTRRGCNKTRRGWNEKRGGLERKTGGVGTKNRRGCGEKKRSRGLEKF
ncbi:MAG: hypothetical protein J6031_07830, partial [Bacteroidales bacterium]|nr:hypothetical protein [Bacteroidales bacterium]